MFYSFAFMSKNTLSTLIVLLLGLLTQVNAFAAQQGDEAKTVSLHIDYKETSSELCWIGAQYDTDKSSQRMNVTDSRHCHPYTLFYNSLFKDKRDEDLVVAELGILYGSSLLMWRDYFQKATIYGFEYNTDLINSFKNTHNNDRINLVHLNVHEQSSIVEAFHSTRVQYDLIIDDSTHQFEDQLRVIENVYPFLKPGGMLIIEDVFKRFNEQDYIDRLKPILDDFQDYYFVSMDHKNRCSTGWDNDKIFVLVKGGGKPIFKNKKKMTIITPSMRPFNLPRVRDSIDFDYVDEWIIVYDANKISENPNLFINEGNPKIKEFIHTSEGVKGNPQRNYALNHIQNEDTYLYFLDDDNLIHKDLYKLLDIIDDGKLYTFDQKNRINGNNIRLGQIDTAMFLIDFKLCKTTRWILNEHEYPADFYYINECCSKNKDKWVYVNNALCTYNILPR
jgi:predicted O-methyltransferase YrrM